MFENAVGKKGGELRDGVSMALIWGSADARLSAACYSSTLALAALFKDFLPGVQICCWGSSLQEPSKQRHLQSRLAAALCASVISPFSWFTLQASVAFCGSLGKKDSLSAPEASLYARFFRKGVFYYCPGQCFSAGCKFAGCVKFKGSMLLYAIEKLPQKLVQGSPHILN